MYELTGRISGVSFSYERRPLITIEFNEVRDALKMVDEFTSEEKLTVKVGKFKQKRSLDANAYCWVLIGKIAEKTNIPKEEVYRIAIRGVGGNYEVVCVQDKAVDSIRAVWEKNGIGWLTDTMPSKVDGCTNVFLYYGSSVFDVVQMSRLISNIQQDCNALGIEVKSQEEIDSLLGAWGR